MQELRPLQTDHRVRGEAPMRVGIGVDQGIHRRPRNRLPLRVEGGLSGNFSVYAEERAKIPARHQPKIGLRFERLLIRSIEQPG